MFELNLLIPTNYTEITSDFNKVAHNTSLVEEINPGNISTKTIYFFAINNKLLNSQTIDKLLSESLNSSVLQILKDGVYTIVDPNGYSSKNEWDYSIAVIADSIHEAKRKANKFLLSHGIPLRVTNSKVTIYRLKDIPKCSGDYRLIINHVFKIPGIKEPVEKIVKFLLNNKNDILEMDFGDDYIEHKGMEVYAFASIPQSKKDYPIFKKFTDGTNRLILSGGGFSTCLEILFYNLVKYKNASGEPYEIHVPLDATYRMGDNIKSSGKAWEDIFFSWECKLKGKEYAIFYDGLPYVIKGKKPQIILHIYSKVERMTEILNLRGK